MSGPVKPNGPGRPLALLMEWFPDLRKAEFDRCVNPDDHSSPPQHETVEGLAARCPVVHDGGTEGVVHLQELEEGLWGSHGCDLGCTWRSIQDCCEFGRRVPGEDDDQEPPKPAPERNRFALAYRRFTVDELAAPPPPRRYILRPYIQAEITGVLSAAGGSGKTTFVSLLAAARACGRRMLRDLVPTPGETAILTTEDRFEDFHEKFAALQEHWGTEFDRAAVAERVHLFDMAGLPVRLVLAERGEQFRVSPEIDELADAMKRLAPRADHLVIETVNRVTGGVESNASLGVLITAGERLSRLTGAAVTFVGHVGQHAGASGRADQYATRGGTSLVDNARSSMVLAKLTGKNADEYAPGLEISDEEMQHMLVLTADKVNGVAPIRPRLLRRLSTPYGPVLDDAAQQPDAAAAPASARRVDKRGRPAKLTYEQMRAAILAYVAKKQPTSGNAVVHDVGGNKANVTGAIADLIKEGLLGRDAESRLVVLKAGSKSSSESSPIQNRLPGTPGSESSSTPLGGVERGRSSEPAGGPSISEPGNSEPHGKEPF